MFRRLRRIIFACALTFSCFSALNYIGYIGSISLVPSTKIVPTSKGSGFNQEYSNNDPSKKIQNQQLLYQKPRGQQQQTLQQKPNQDNTVAPGNKQRSAENTESLHKQIRQLSNRIAVLEKQRKTYPKITFRPYAGPNRRKRILITGGAGFVGSHLVDKLMLDGHEVTVVDNFFTGRKQNVEHWVGHENFELVNHDVVNPIYLEVDQIYHLSSPASPPHYMYNPVKTIKTNTIGTINMLGLARRVKARMLMASTSEVYGDPEVHPQKEEYWGHVNPIGPRACYDEGKRVAETICYAYQKQEDVQVRVARIFNTFGPRMHMNDGRVVSNFVLQALQSINITVYGKGAQTRSFQYVSDLVDGLVALMNSNYTKPVNLGNPDEHTILEFATRIKKLVEETAGVHSTSAIVHKPAVTDDPQRRRPDISVAKKYLNWEPKISMDDGIKNTILYFKNELARKKHSERNIWHPHFEEFKTRKQGWRGPP